MPSTNSWFIWHYNFFKIDYSDENDTAQKGVTTAALTLAALAHQKVETNMKGWRIRSYRVSKTHPGGHRQRHPDKDGGWLQLKSGEWVTRGRK